MRNNFNQKYGDIAKYALLKVLEIDSKNISANINLGILYYNQGATLMRMMDYDVDLAQLDVIQENAKKFKVSFEEELHRVMIHGVLHLCGYKDKSKSDTELMRKKENWALNLKCY